MGIKITRTSSGIDIGKIAKKIDSVSAQVGWFESAKYPDGTPVAYVAAIQEFGYPAGNIPPRSFIRTTVDEKTNAWGDIAAKSAKAVLSGDANASDVIELMATAAVGDIQKKITQINNPPLKQSTINARARRYANASGGASGKPLVDTGLMLQTITYVMDGK